MPKSRPQAQQNNPPPPVTRNAWAFFPGKFDSWLHPKCLAIFFHLFENQTAECLWVRPCFIHHQQRGGNSADQRRGSVVWSNVCCSRLCFPRPKMYATKRSVVHMIFPVEKLVFELTPNHKNVCWKKIFKQTLQVHRTFLRDNFFRVPNHFISFFLGYTIRHPSRAQLRPASLCPG